MLRIGTDCSGIEAPIQALLQLESEGLLPNGFSHEFSSEIDKYAIQSIKANYHPKVIYEDMTKREAKDVPDIDLYVCGFPCQPFSQAGKRKGFEDDRGNIFFQCLKVIQSKRPKYFILENVKGLLTHDKGNTFKVIMNCLQKLPEYNIHWKVLNTKDFGIPQSRERIFIVGTKGEFSFNNLERQESLPLMSYIDHTDTTRNTLPPRVERSKMMDKLPLNSVFVDFSFANSRFINSHEICPCLVKKGDLWNVPLHRRANAKELLSLQGFSQNFKQVVSKTQLYYQLGNTMSVNVLKAILKELIY